MKRLRNNIISVIYSFIRFALMKLLHGKRFSFHVIERFSPKTEIYFLGRKGIISLGKYVLAHSDCRFRVIGHGIIRIDTNAKFNYGCMITSRRRIHIGAGVEFGPNVLLYDHDHDFRAKGGLQADKYREGEIEIGENCWIGANTVILRNTKLGRNCVVAAGCVLGNCSYPDNTIIYQKRDTQTKSFVIEP